MVNKDKLKELIYEINLQYGNRMYQSVSGDEFLVNIPQKLVELWHDLYIITQASEEETESAYEKIIALKDALAHEFELIDKANIMKGE